MEGEIPELNLESGYGHSLQKWRLFLTLCGSCLVLSNTQKANTGLDFAVFWPRISLLKVTSSSWASGRKKRKTKGDLTFSLDR